MELNSIQDHKITPVYLLAATAAVRVISNLQVCADGELQHFTTNVTADLILS